MSEAERQEINTKLQGLATGSLMTGQQMQELLMETSLDEATKKRILSETGLTNAIGIGTIAEKAYVQTQLQELMNRGIITEDIYKAIMAKMADTAATNTQTSANLGLAASFKTLMASMGPIGWISIGISLLVSAFQLIAPHIKSANEQLEETHQALADIRSERENLNNELKTTEERIAELEAKGALSFTDEAELTRLKQENAELERKIILLDQEAKTERENATKKFKKAYSGDFSIGYSPRSMYETEQSEVSGLGVFPKIISYKEAILELDRAINELEKPENEGKYIADAYSGGKIIDTNTSGYGGRNLKSLQEQAGEYKEQVIEWQKELSKLKEDGIVYSDLDDETKKIVDNMNEAIDAYMVTIGEADALFSSIYNRDKYVEARIAIEELGTVTAESLAGLYKSNDKVKELIDYMLSLNTVNWKTMLGDDFDRVAKSDVDDGIVSITEALDWMNESGENSSKIMGLFANELNKVEDAAEGATASATAFTNLSKDISKMVDKYDALIEAQNELAESGNLSASTLEKLAEKYPELNDDIGEYLFGLISQEEFMQRLQNLYNTDYSNYQKSLQAKMNTTTEYWNHLLSKYPDVINSISNSYKVDFANCKTVEEAKAKIRQTYMTQWMQEYNKYVELSLSEAKLLRKELSVRNSNGQNTQKIADLDAYIRMLTKVDEDFNTKLPTFDKFNPKRLTSVDVGTKEDKNKEAAEKYFAKLKYNLETNKITEEQYLKSLDAAYKKYYGNKSKYLDEYSQYSQEVYDGFKDMYKDDLEAKKESLEKQKEAVTKYYDDLIEKIQEKNDAEDYKEEQSEKRQTISEIDRQIAELEKDGSERAKARIAELEEDRKNAEKELEDFEKDRAREKEIERLEKEKEKREKEVQKKIDNIDTKLSNLDTNTKDIRNAVVAYAKSKGVNIKFAYASGTRSSVGGFGRINEKGIEMISAPDGNGNYIPMLPSSYVFSAKATEFLWKLATEHSLPQAMYNSIAKSIKTQSSTPSVNIAQPITITMGDVIIKGNADKQTVADIKKQQENTVRMVLQKIKELQK